MRKVLGFIWGLFKNNLVLKIMALFFAIVLWSYVLSETNPARDKVLPEVPITYTHQEQLDAQDLAISRSLSEQLEKVSVRVKVSQNYIKYLTPNSVQLTVDLSKINDIGEWTLDISATSANSNCTVVEVNPSTVTLTVDRKVTRTLPVAMEVAGSVTSGYYASDPVPEPDTVTLSGARADLENASSAVCAVDISGLTSWIKKSWCDILDSEGNARIRAYSETCLR
jgi:YbbR domain-containing protein